VGSLFVTTAVIEAGAGLALLCLPSAAAKILLGTPLQEPSACTVARVGGAGLIALGVACWLARSDAESSAGRGLITAMVVYNLGVALILAAAGLRSQPVGIVLWPAVVLHTAMTVWCIVSLRNPSIVHRPWNLQQ
jgi:cytochrome c biogenesis protein CcdA